MKREAKLVGGISVIERIKQNIKAEAAARARATAEDAEEAD